MIMAINVEPDSRTLSSSVVWPWKSHYMRKSVFRDLRLTDSKGLQPETVLDAHASLCTAIWTPCYPVYTLLSMRGSRIFVRGGGGGGAGGPSQSDKKKPWQGFFSPQLILLISKKTIIFQGSRGGPTFSRGGGGGGVQLFPGGSNCLYPIETHITCDFPGGPDPLTPL